MSTHRLTHGSPRALRLAALLAALLLLIACGLTGCASSAKKETRDRTVGIEPQVVFSQDGITVTLDRYELTDDLLHLYGTADNESSKDLGSFLGSAYIGGIGVNAYAHVEKSLLPAGSKGTACELFIDFSDLRPFGVTREMIGGEIPVFLTVSDKDYKAAAHGTGTVTLPAAQTALTVPDMGDYLRIFTCHKDKWDYTLTYMGEDRPEAGGLDLYIGVINRSGEPLIPIITFTGINGVELEKKLSLTVPAAAPGGTCIGTLRLSAETCAACGVNEFADIETLSFTHTGVLRSHTEPSELLVYREDDAHPAGKPAVTPRGTLQVDAARDGEDRVKVEIRLDTTTAPNEAALKSLIADIEALTFVNGCGERIPAEGLTAAVDGKDLCYTGTLQVYNTDEALSLCFLVIGDDAWLLG